MDRKSIALIVVVIAALFLGTKLINRAFPPVPVPVATNQISSASNTVAAGTNESTPTLSTASTAQPAVSATNAAPVKFTVNEEVPEQLLTVSNSDARYTFTSRGGGLQLVDLLKYPQSVRATRLHPVPTNGVATLNTPVALPVLALLGDDSIQGDGIYALSPIPGGVRAAKTLPNGLSVTKDFVIGTNFLIAATVHIKNTSAKPVTVPALDWSVGTSTPMSPQDNGYADSVMWYNGIKSGSVPQSYFSTNKTVLMMFPRTVRSEFRTGSTNVAWVSAQNQFFSLATMTESNTLPAEIVVRSVMLPPPSEEEIEASSRTVLAPMGLEAMLECPGVTLAPGQETTVKFNVFAGPKIYRMLAALAEQMGNDIDKVMGFGMWGFITKPLLAAMNALYHSLSFPYGASIILITVVIRLAIWPLTRASMRSMKRMQELQPQIKALQEKYKDDPQKFQQKSWEFYKKNKVNPLGGCLPMVLQIPLIFGFYGVLRNAIELRGAHFLWIGDLSQPDTIFTLPFMGHNLPINPMPLIMGAAQFWQASVTPSSPSMDPSQQKMMRYLPLMMVYFFYNYSSGLALYWTLSCLMTILQNRFTKTQPAVAAAATVPATTVKKK